MSNGFALLGDVVSACGAILHGGVIGTSSGRNLGLRMPVCEVPPNWSWMLDPCFESVVRNGDKHAHLYYDVRTNRYTLSTISDGSTKGLVLDCSTMGAALTSYFKVYDYFGIPLTAAILGSEPGKIFISKIDAEGKSDAVVEMNCERTIHPISSKEMSLKLCTGDIIWAFSGVSKTINKSKATTKKCERHGFLTRALTLDVLKAAEPCPILGWADAIGEASLSGKYDHSKNLKGWETAFKYAVLKGYPADKAETPSDPRSGIRSSLKTTTLASFMADQRAQPLKVIQSSSNSDWKSLLRSNDIPREEQKMRKGSDTANELSDIETADQDEKASQLYKEIHEKKRKVDENQGLLVSPDGLESYDDVRFWSWIRNFYVRTPLDYASCLVEYNDALEERTKGAEAIKQRNYFKALILCRVHLQFDELGIEDRIHLVRYNEKSNIIKEAKKHNIAWFFDNETYQDIDDDEGASLYKKEDDDAFTEILAEMKEKTIKKPKTSEVDEPNTVPAPAFINEETVKTTGFAKNRNNSFISAQDTINEIKAGLSPLADLNNNLSEINSLFSSCANVLKLLDSAETTPATFKIINFPQKNMRDKFYGKVTFGLFSSGRIKMLSATDCANLLIKALNGKGELANILGQHPIEICTMTISRIVYGVMSSADNVVEAIAKTPLFNELELWLSNYFDSDIRIGVVINSERSGDNGKSYLEYSTTIWQVRKPAQKGKQDNWTTFVKRVLSS